MDLRVFPRFQCRSLKTKVSLATLAIFLAGLWSLSFYASRILREDMQRQLGDQQLSTISMVATQINNGLSLRLSALENTARMAAKIMREDPTSLQTFMSQRAALQTLFNGGVSIHDSSRAVIARFPALRHTETPDEKDSNVIENALREGKSSVSALIAEKTSTAPAFHMAVPLSDDTGTIVGALARTIDLSKPSFLNQIIGSHFAKRGKFDLIDPQRRIAVTAADAGLVMKRIPPPGEDPIADRFSQCSEGTSIFISPEGQELLISIKSVPITGWQAIVVLPTEEAFAPIRHMQRRVFFATLLFSLLASALTWWILRHQLSPLITTTEVLASMADSSQPFHPLPIVRKDEIGKLIAGFNRLLTTLEQRETLLQKILDTSSVAIFLVDNDGRITQANQRMAEMFSRPLETLIGADYATLIHPSERESGQQKMMELLGSETDSVALDRRYQRADLTDFWGHVTGQRFYDADGTKRGLVGVIADIDERKRAEKQLEHMAHYDVLTTLPNRVLLADRLHQAMAQTQRHRQLLAVAYLDLDGFKAINDTHGHETGDRLLVALAQRMKSALREGDTLARLGGDEFVAVLMDINDVAVSISMINRLLDAASEPVAIGDHVLRVSASLGVTFYPQNETVDADQLLRQADQSMYQAKLAGKNRYHIFDAEQDRNVRGHNESLQRIQEALAAGEFVLYYQPKVNMHTGKIVGAEALIRWRHPEKGLLSPSAFLPVIENHPVSVDLGEWVIETALATRERWGDAGLNLPVSVNIGARQLQRPDFIDRLREILARHPTLRAGDLELEILETSALEDLSGVSRVIRNCRALGINFALDDFGAGYSSLTYLKRLPMSMLKIDQSFVRDMRDNPDDLAILEGIISLASAFRRKVIAEGVETIAHGRLLLQLGCQLAQGFGIARPMPAEELPEWAKSWRPDATWQRELPIDRGDFPLLFAIAEHRSWMIGVRACLNNDTETPPPMDIHQCRLGQWLEDDGLTRHGAKPVFQSIEQLHRQVHQMAEGLYNGKKQPNPRGPQTDQSKFDEMSDALQAQLQVLIQKSLAMPDDSPRTHQTSGSP